MDEGLILLWGICGLHIYLREARGKIAHLPPCVIPVFKGGGGIASFPKQATLSVVQRSRGINDCKFPVLLKVYIEANTSNLKKEAEGNEHRTPFDSVWSVG